MTADSTPPAATAATRIASRFRSVAFFGCLLVSVLAGSPAAAQSPGSTPAHRPAESPSELAVGQPESPAAMAAATSSPAQDLSLFGIMALGIIGLLWVRRHTAEH